MIDVTLNVLMELLSHDTVDSCYLSEKYEVSNRSIYRYIDSLLSAGIPIKKERGRNGGFSIDKSFRVSYMFFTEEEFTAIKSGLNLLSDIDSFSEIIGSVNSKLCTLKEAEKIDVSAIDSDSLVISDNCWGDNPKLKAFIANIFFAIKNNKLISTKYHNRNGEILTRVVEPHTFVLNNGEWYVYSYCRIRDDWRLFKLMRMTELTVLDETFDRRIFSRDWKLSFREDTETISLVMEVKDEAKYEVEEWVGVENVRKQNDTLIASITLSANDKLYGKLLSLGNGIKLLSPEKVIVEYKRRLKEIIDIY